MFVLTIKHTVPPLTIKPPGPTKGKFQDAELSPILSLTTAELAIFTPAQIAFTRRLAFDVSERSGDAANKRSASSSNDEAEGVVKVKLFCIDLAIRRDDIAISRSAEASKLLRPRASCSSGDRDRQSDREICKPSSAPSWSGGVPHSAHALGDLLKVLKLNFPLDDHVSD